MMSRSRRTPARGLAGERSRFASHYPSRAGRPDTPPQIFWMFAEDAHTHIMPFPRLSEPKGRRFDAVLESADAAIALRVIQGLGEHTSRHSDTLEATCDAVRGITQRLLWNVKSAYEIPVITNEQREENEFMPDDDGVIRMRSFTTARLFHLPGLFVQIPPFKDREYFGRWMFSARSRHVWLVSMPRALGGSSGYRRLRHRLSRFQLTSPMWAPEAMTKEPDVVRYDFLGHRRLLELYVARAVRPWGWNRRDWSDDHQTQFFNFYRMITFQWALAVLRDHIIEELNVLLRRMDVTARLSLKGFLTPDEILATRERMCRGEINIGDAYSAVGYTLKDS